MPRNMFLRDRIPRPVFDRDPRLVTHRFEAHFDLRRLLRRKARLPPAEDKALAGFPHRYAADLEGLAVIQMRNEAAADTGLEGELTITARRNLKERVRLPPG